MFKKVFGNHMAGNPEGAVVMEGGSRQSPYLPEDDNIMPEAPQEDAAQDAQSRAARAKEIHEKMLQSQNAPAAMQTAPDQPPAAPSPPVQSSPDPRPAGRARTRLIGFNAGAERPADPFEQASQQEEPAKGFPTGWVVVIKGPGQGQFMPVFSGVSMIGRGDDQAISLNFGDMAISRQNHAAIAHDAETNQFYLGHGGKSNIIRLNDRPVLSTEDLGHGDIIRIGETTLRFAALCGPDFNWADIAHD